MKNTRADRGKSGIKWKAVGTCRKKHVQTYKKVSGKERDWCVAMPITGISYCSLRQVSILHWIIRLEGITQKGMSLVIRSSKEKHPPGFRLKASRGRSMWYKINVHKTQLYLMESFLFSVRINNRTLYLLEFSHQTERYPMYKHL